MQRNNKKNINNNRKNNQNRRQNSKLTLQELKKQREYQLIKPAPRKKNIRYKQKKLTKKQAMLVAFYGALVIMSSIVTPFTPINHNNKNRKKSNSTTDNNIKNELKKDNGTQEIKNNTQSLSSPKNEEISIQKICTDMQSLNAPNKPQVVLGASPEGVEMPYSCVKNIESLECQKDKVIYNEHRNPSFFMKFMNWVYPPLDSLKSFRANRKEIVDSWHKNTVSDLVKEIRLLKTKEQRRIATNMINRLIFLKRELTQIEDLLTKEIRGQCGEHTAISLYRLLTEEETLLSLNIAVLDIYKEYQKDGSIVEIIDNHLFLLLDENEIEPLELNDSNRIGEYLANKTKCDSWNGSYGKDSNAYYQLYKTLTIFDNVNPRHEMSAKKIKALPKKMRNSICDEFKKMSIKFSDIDTHPCNLDKKL